MAHGHFLVRNRHNNTWYGRVTIPQSLRPLFNDRREIRQSLGTPDKQRAKRLSRLFWVQCQAGFERLQQQTAPSAPFVQSSAFIEWLSQHNNNGLNQDAMAYYIETFDAMGRKHVIDLDNPEQEKELALQLQANAAAILDRYKDNPGILDRLLSLNTTLLTPENKPETPTSFHDAVEAYFDKLSTQGRKGKKLAPRTLLHYKDKLNFWQQHFGQREIHTLTLKELGDIQNWLTRLPSNLTKKGLSVEKAVKLAQEVTSEYPAIADKTRAEYVGQLKGILEYAYSNGFITNDMASHIEIPNANQSKAIERQPFSTDDLRNIFPGDRYGVDFGIHKSGIDPAAKFWFPLLAAFSGARLEELGQLNASDIRTCPETGIVYAMIDNEGVAADGHKKHTKNLNSVRPIPIHSKLIKIGFMGYLKEREADTENGMLFKLNRDKQGRVGKSVANWFSRMEKRKNGVPILGYIERRGVHSKGANAAGERWSKSFHSFRHTAIDNLRGMKLANGEYIREPDIGLVMGHDKEKLETASYGVDRSQLELRKAVIEAINYPGVPFGSISWKQFNNPKKAKVAAKKPSKPLPTLDI